MITAGAAYLLVVLLLVVYSGILSSFLIVFSVSVLLSAYGLIPAFMWPVIELLGVLSLWVELAQIEGNKHLSSPSPKEEQMSRLSWAGGGIACGGLLAIVLGKSLVCTAAGGFIAVVLLSLIQGNSLAKALRSGLLIVEENPSASVMKSGFWFLLCLTLLFSSFA